MANPRVRVIGSSILWEVHRAWPWWRRFENAAAILVLAAAVFAPGLAAADGALLGRSFEDIYEPEQTAFLIHDAAAEQEDLILRVAFEGAGRDFGWIVPVPALPTVTAAPAEIFTESAELSEPVTQDRDPGCTSGDGRTGRVGPSGVEIYEQHPVGIYSSMVVGSDNAFALTDSLTRWGYLHTSNRDQAEELLAYYTNRAWYFAVFRIDSTSVQYDSPSRTLGVLPPVRISFHSAEPVYPLRISALSTGSANAVAVYVCAAHRMTFPGAQLEYANRISSPELRSIRQRYPHVGALLQEGIFLTKLTKVYSAGEMNEDLVLSQASTDEEYRQIQYGGIPVVELIALAAGAAATWRRRHRQRVG